MGRKMVAGMREESDGLPKSVTTAALASHTCLNDADVMGSVAEKGCRYERGGSGGLPISIYSLVMIGALALHT